MSSSYKLVIFDWEGTLGDSIERKMILGACEFIDRLQRAGIILAIATNKSEASLQKDLSFFELTNMFKVTRTANRTAPKPDPLMLREILTETGIPPQESLMIGDSEADMAMARSMEVKAIGIDLSGRYSASLRLAGACHVVRDYKELNQFFDVILNPNQVV